MSSVLKRNRKESKKFQANFSFLQNQPGRREPSTPARRKRHMGSYSTPTIEMLDEDEETKTNR